jgi:hypothetical protein
LNSGATKIGKVAQKPRRIERDVGGPRLGELHVGAAVGADQALVYSQDACDAPHQLEPAQSLGTADVDQTR